MSEVSKSVANFVSETMEQHPVATKIYLGGVVISVLAHSVLKGAKYFSAWKTTQRNVPTEDRVESAVSATLTGTAWGFVQGSIRGWIWPVHVITLAIVFTSKDVHSNSLKN